MLLFYLVVVALLPTASDTSLTRAAMQRFAPTLAPLARRRLPPGRGGSDANLCGAHGGISIDRPGIQLLVMPWDKGGKLQ